MLVHPDTTENQVIHTFPKTNTSRIDQMHISDTYMDLLPQTSIKLNYYGPFDHKGLSLSILNNSKCGKGYWKLNSALLKIPSTIEEIKKKTTTSHIAFVKQI